jgi:transforming growth factor-beta-induced protein
MSCQVAGLSEALSGSGPFTVFAPTDAAFAALPNGTVESLLKPENKQQLIDILKYHVVSGRVYSEDALKAKSAKTLQGSPIQVNVTSGGAAINNAGLVKTDIDASNGVIHVIDAVLLPPAKKVSAVEARDMIHNAVARGCRLYNGGHHRQCAKVYMTTARKMVEYGEDLPPSVRSSLTSALSKAQSTHCPVRQSWTLRRGLDRAYYVMRVTD